MPGPLVVKIKRKSPTPRESFQSLARQSKGSKRLILSTSAEPRDESDPGPAIPSGSMSVPFANDLIASAQSKSVPLPPLQTILARLIGAGVHDAEIPERLLVAAGQLQTRRASLADWRDEGPGHAHSRSEALALVDRGDFDSAAEVLRHGRETGWTFPMATRREEAEYLAREAMIDHIQLRFCAAAESYAAAAALVADGGGTGAWRFLIEQAHELCADGREFGTRENVLRAIEIYHRALGLVGRENSPLDWATTKHHLGGALLLLGESDEDTGPLREAVDVYLAAIEEWTLERAPPIGRKHK